MSIHKLDEGICSLAEDKGLREHFSSEKNLTKFLNSGTKQNSMLLSVICQHSAVSIHQFCIIWKEKDVKNFWIADRVK